MAEREKKGGHYEMTLENRHLLGVFFAVVLLCAIFFTLGFVLGRNQAVAKVPASPPQKPSAPAPAASPAPASAPPGVARGPTGGVPRAPAPPPQNPPAPAPAASPAPDDLSFYERV